MNKIYRIKSSAGGLAVSLDKITAIRYANEGDGVHNVEIIMDSGAMLDATMSSEELEALQRAWNEKL